MTLLACLLRRASAAGPTDPVVFAAFVGVVPAAGTVLIVVLLVVEVLLKWIANGRCVLVAVQLSSAEQQPLRVAFLVCCNACNDNYD